MIKQTDEKFFGICEEAICEIADEIDDEDLIDELGGIDKIFAMRASWIMEDIFVPCPLTIK